MDIRLNIKRLAIGGGDFSLSSYFKRCAVARSRNALTITAFVVFAVLVMAPALAGCSKGDEPVRDNDPVTRALTHEDSVRLGLVIDGMKANPEWEDTMDVNFCKQQLPDF